MIPNHINILIEKYHNGFKGGHGISPPIEPNPIPNYQKFTEHWLNLKREGTVRNYLSILHRWNIPINYINIKNWSESIKLINDLRHNYKDHIVKSKNGKLYTYKKVHKYKLLDDDEKKDNRKHFEYRMYRVMVMYLIAINDKKLLNLMPNVKSIPKITHNIRTGNFKEDEFKKFISYIDDEQVKLMFLLMFYTGARIREVIQVKKNNSWFPNLKDGKIELKSGEIFKTIIPKIYVKSKKADESLYFINVEIENMLINYVNKCEDNQYIFNLIPGMKRSRNYLDEQSMKNYFNKKLEYYLSISGFSHEIGNFTAHSFRRGFVHYMYKKSGNDIVFTSNVTRHKSGVVMTDKYLKQDVIKTEQKINEMRE